MEEDTRGNQTNDWDDKKKNNRCIINIFCKEKKQDGMDYEKKNDDHCIINIFCSDMKHEGISDCKKNDEQCIINIFCNAMKQTDKCNDQKDW